MTEKEWLTCTDPTPMLEYLRGKTSDRKLLFFAVGCWDRSWNSLADEESRNGVRALEALAEGSPPEDKPLHLIENGDWLIICGGRYNAGLMVGPGYAANTATYSLTMVADAEAEERGDLSHKRCRQTYLPLVRDIFGNPFRPITAVPAWLTPTVVSLAEAIYTDRAFDRLPILADALEEAGCDNTGVLGHCRGDGPHVRGCWVIDLLLGRS